MAVLALSAPTCSATDVRKIAAVGCLLAALIVLPVYVYAKDAPFYLVFASRVLIYAIAATSLNLVLGYGGMVSFGHALFLGVGAYSVGLCAFYGVTNGLVQLAIAATASSLIGLVTGLIALRTRGVAFIMITLAFAQMFYFLIFSLKQYGGDEGLTIRTASHIGYVSLGNRYFLYISLVITLLLVLYAKSRLINSTFGLVLRGCMHNEDRMKALGFPTLRYKITAYVIASAVCGIAGFFLANLTLFASPDYASWMVSGDMMLMVVVGGPGTVVGPAVGALILLVLEDILKRLTGHWMGILGVVIIAVGLLAKRGVWGLLERHQ
jgi:branched-chain amino acid transport system permease protein